MSTRDERTFKLWQKSIMDTNEDDRNKYYQKCEQCGVWKDKISKYFKRISKNRVDTLCIVCKKNNTMAKKQVIHKECRICGESKPTTMVYFHVSNRNKDKLTSACKKCRNEYGKKERKKENGI